MNELTFLDLVVMLKVDAESTVEKFGSQINTSFFEAANLLGTMKLKGYIDIMSSVGGMSRVVLTDAGASILTLAKEKSIEPLDLLDNSILSTLASGVSDLDALMQSLNIRGGDLAYHLHKLYAQQYVDYSVRSSRVSVSLTEKGFNTAGGLKNKISPQGEQKTNPITGVQTHMPTTEPPASTTQPVASAPAVSTAPASSTSEPIVAATASANSPPWVDKSTISVSEASSAGASEDVRELLSHPMLHPITKHMQRHKKQAGVREAKPKNIKTERALSKLSFYAKQYLFYGLLIVLFISLIIVTIGASYIKLR